MLNIDIKYLSAIHDERGWLVEVLKNGDVSGTFGQIYITVARPNKVKGNHFHKKKTEWVHVIHGKAKIVLHSVETGDSHEMVIDNNTTVIKIPPMVAHGFKNISSEILYILIYSDRVYDKKNPDSCPRVVLS